MFPPLLLVAALLLFNGATASITIAIKYDNGIVVGSDNYYISSAQTSYISSTEAYKVDFITDSTVMCRIGTERTNGAEYYQLFDELTSSIKLIDCDSQHVSSLDGQGSRYSSVLGTGAIAALARKLMTSKYKNTHVIIAGIDDEGFRQRKLLFMTKESTGSMAITRSRSNGDYKPHLAMFEILPGGAKLSDAAYLTAGSSSSLVNPLLEQLIATATDSKNQQQTGSSIASISASSGSGGQGSMAVLFDKFLNFFNILDDDSKRVPVALFTPLLYDGISRSSSSSLIDEGAAVRAMYTALRAASREDNQSGGKLSAFTLFFDGKALACRATGQ